MPSFVWKGKNRFGAFQEGVLIADSRDAAAATLRRQNIQVTSVREKGKEVRLLPKLPFNVSAKRVALFTRQFSVMLDAGLPLVQCLEILGEQEEDRNFREIIQTVRTDVEAGSSLAESMRKHPRAFNKLYVSMIAAGEAGGILDIILQRLATYIEKVVKLNAQVKSALMYPVTIIVIATGVVILILWKVIPVFAQLFAGLGGELPFLTRVVVNSSNFLGRYFPWLVLVGVLLYMAFQRWYKTERGRRIIDATVLKIPVIGMLVRKIAVARFCRTLATLTSSGVPILDGLEITARTAGNAIIEDAIMVVRKGVESGLTVAQPLKETGVFPPMVIQMIGVGEQTGALDAMLSKIADFYEEEVDQAVANLLTLMEPIMILFLGVTVGGIIVAMYLPLFDLISKLS